MMEANHQIPPGWQYNPSTWSQRIPIIILAFLGVVVAGYLSLYQFKMIDSVWDPFFGKDSIKILDSKISHVLPIPDAALGAFGYLVDAVTGIIGGKTRWRKMPWIVIVFGLAVGPLGFVSVMLVVFQPVLFSAWCFLCLVSAVISIAMIGPAMDEMLASLQFMQRAKHAKVSMWKVFWGIKSEVSKVR